MNLVIEVHIDKKSDALPVINEKMAVACMHTCMLICIQSKQSGLSFLSENK